MIKTLFFLFSFQITPYWLLLQSGNPQFFSNSKVAISPVTWPVLSANPAPVPAAVPPVKFLRFAVSTSASYIQLDWRSAEEESANMYYVERSNNGENWKEIGSLIIKSQASFNEYTFRDPNPGPGLNYYRIRQESIDSLKSYSLTRMVYIEDNSISVALSPVPVQDIVKVTIRGYLKFTETAMVRIMDMSGRVIMTRAIQLDKPEGIIEINIRHYKPGAYIMFIRNNTIAWTGTFIKD